MKRRLPIGIQDFASIREEGYVYVDKTARIHELITGSGYGFFLTRPRRFGKSLLCSTLAAIFQGRRELFSGLAIDGLDWEWRKHPVIHLDLNPGDYEKGIDELAVTIKRSLEICANQYGVPFTGESLSDFFARLIINLYDKYREKIAVVIDEYDKPLLSTISNKELHSITRNALKGFYAVLKSYDPYLKLVLLTGVTKFSQVSVFSELNNLTDISLNPDFYDICGITQKELETEFQPEINAMVKQKQCSKTEYLQKLKKFYNGYRFSEQVNTLYNPFGLFTHFNNHGKFDPYWFSTGTPTFLIKLMEMQKIDILHLEKTTLTLVGLQKFNVDTMDALAVLYQSGYLTIVGYDDEFGEYTLDYPNEEVRSAFAFALLEQYIHVSSQEVNGLSVRLPKALIQGDIDRAMNMLQSFFAEIPYDITLQYEKYYQTVIHLIFRMLGMCCQSEVKIASGRIDTVVETKDLVYCFEFKLEGTVEEALRQIEDKGYLVPWQGKGKRLMKVGVVFDPKKRNIRDWKPLPG
jgi:hypothetical protein